VENKVILNATSSGAPALASHDGRLFVAWQASGNPQLNLAFSGDNGTTFTGTCTLPDASDYAPALASHNGRLFLAWSGYKNEKVNVAPVVLIGDTAGGFAIQGVENKVILNATSPAAPALASHNDRLFLAWRGDGANYLNLRVSADGS